MTASEGLSGEAQIRIRSLHADAGICRLNAEKEKLTDICSGSISRRCMSRHSRQQVPGQQVHGPDMGTGSGAAGAGNAPDDDVVDGDLQRGLIKIVSKCDAAECHRWIRITEARACGRVHMRYCLISK